MIRYRIIRFFILLIALAVGNGTTVSPNPVNTPYATIASVIHIGIQPAYAKKTKKAKKALTLWTCTCQLYADRTGWFRVRGKFVRQWEGKVRSGYDSSTPTRVIAEVYANSVCEKKTKGVDCQECGCSIPRH